MDEWNISLFIIPVMNGHKITIVYMNVIHRLILLHSFDAVFKSPNAPNSKFSGAEPLMRELIQRSPDLL